ncbi:MULTISPECIES: DUF7824 domain-containing protein [unclassified Streptomyces]|uniref:DUF7824 domain-containing protein n=1 Tax=unclassified Streptomyces TaxID=2593676 RepID=UPI000DAB6F93|nr:MULTISPECIES: DUF6493 family protein [unclassified Streptomyces]PZT73731.1 hypothetical protein DNK55_15975 [Streptomyces sp. AC1-42T]PZT83275.1 hypothetical protein DNK56_15450 [Streptomyces sp. AC1-42W]
MSTLLDAVREGRLDDVPALVARLDRRERKAALDELKELRKEARGWAWDARTRVRKAVVVAGAGCHTGAAGCATWLGAREMRDWTHSPYPWVLQVLADRDPAWLADLAGRLAARAVETEAEYRLVVELARRAECPLPVTDGMVQMWAELVSGSRWQWKRRVPLVEVLRKEDDLRGLVAHLLTMPELPSSVAWVDSASPGDYWPAALGTLAAEGRLDRGALLDACVARLLRGGGKPTDLRFCLLVVRGLEPTPEEEAARVADWTALAADGPSTVAGHAQEVLGRLHAQGALSVRQLAEVSGAVLFRTEKKLVRAQLIQLGKVLRREASAADELLPVIADAFGHPDTDAQERALKLVARVLPAASPEVREEVAGMAAQLAPVHRQAALAVFGDLLEDEPAVPYEEILPPPPVPRPLGPPHGSVAELAEEVTAVLISPDQEDITAFERALDGLVRYAHQGTRELVEALEPALAGLWWATTPKGEVEWRMSRDGGSLHTVAASLLDRFPMKVVHDARAHRSGTAKCCHEALNGIMSARMWEAAAELRSGRLPYLLATPTWHTGSIDAAELVERLRGYRALGVRAAPVDFAQALLRVRRADAEEAARGADELGTEEGDRLAAWLRADEPVASVVPRHVDTDVQVGRDWLRQTVIRARRALLATRDNPLVRQKFPPAFHWLGSAHSPRDKDCYCWVAESPHWVATLPEDGESLAAWLLPSVAACVQEDRGHTWLLPTLAETGGPAADAIHLAVAYGLGARQAEDRLSTVDALLVLAGRGQLDAGLLGRELAVLIEQESVKPNRLADAVRTAAETGAYGTVLSVLVPVLPALLGRERAPRGLSDLLAVAAECAERSGPPATGAVPGVAATAARGGTTQLVRQAIRLEAACRAAEGLPLG